jgi:hypothetical protein
MYKMLGSTYPTDNGETIEVNSIFSSWDVVAIITMIIDLYWIYYFWFSYNPLLFTLFTLFKILLIEINNTKNDDKLNHDHGKIVISMLYIICVYFKYSIYNLHIYLLSKLLLWVLTSYNEYIFKVMVKCLLFCKYLITRIYVCFTYTVKQIKYVLYKTYLLFANNKKLIIAFIIGCVISYIITNEITKHDNIDNSEGIDTNTDIDCDRLMRYLEVDKLIREFDELMMDNIDSNAKKRIKKNVRSINKFLHEDRIKHLFSECIVPFTVKLNTINSRYNDIKHYL